MRTLFSLTLLLIGLLCWAPPAQAQNCSGSCSEEDGLFVIEFGCCPSGSDLATAEKSCGPSFGPEDDAVIETPRRCFKDVVDIVRVGGGKDEPEPFRPRDLIAGLAALLGGVIGAFIGRRRRFDDRPGPGGL